jgi:hypothetical protein
VFAPKIAKAHDRPTRKPAPQISTLGARPLGGGAVEQAQMLRGTIGNQATLRYLTHRHDNLPAKGPAERDEQEAVPENMAAGEAPRGPSWDFSKLPVFPPDQAELAVGRVNDPLEHEADRVADLVMRMPDPVPSIAIAPPQIKRNSTAREEGEKGTLQPKSAATAKPVGGAPRIVHEVLNSPGQPLDAETRAYFEPRFARTFVDVRIHTGSRAAESARSIAAAAYTVGAHLVFGAGRYEPRELRGRALLAHELAHFTQQRNDPATSTILRREPDDTRPTYGNLYPGDTQDSARIVRLERVGDLWYEVGPRGDRHRASGHYDFVVRRGEVRALRLKSSAVGADAPGHLTLSGGGRVEYAGQVRFGRGESTKGVVSEWSNASGHLAPTGGGKDPANERLLDVVPFPRDRFRRVVGRAQKGPQLPVFQPSKDKVVEPHGGEDAKKPGGTKPTPGTDVQPRGAIGGGGARPAPKTTASAPQKTGALELGQQSPKISNQARAIASADAQLRRARALGGRLAGYYKAWQLLQQGLAALDAITTAEDLITHGTALPKEQAEADGVAKESDQAVAEVDATVAEISWLYWVGRIADAQKAQNQVQLDQIIGDLIEIKLPMEQSAQNLQGIADDLTQSSKRMREESQHQWKIAVRAQGESTLPNAVAAALWDATTRLSGTIAGAAGNYGAAAETLRNVAEALNQLEDAADDAAKLIAFERMTQAQHKVDLEQGSKKN